MKELFINTIANSCAGTALFSLPTTEGTGGIGEYQNVVGFLIDDPTISMKSTWEALLPDATSLSEWSSIAGLGAVSWIASSKATWKGTDPITLTLNFYLLTYRNAQLTGTEQGDPRNLPVSKQAACFAALLAVAPKHADDNSGRFAGYGVRVHGNYRANLFEENNDFEGNKRNHDSDGLYVKYFGDAMDLAQGSLSDGSEDDSTVNIVINGGGKPSQFFSKMLLTDATFTPSPVRCGYWVGDRSNGRQFVRTSEPLYVRVSATFRLAHTATVRDAVRMFTGSTSF